jgi:hypothetical protein
MKPNATQNQRTLAKRSVSMLVWITVTVLIFGVFTVLIPQMAHHQERLEQGAHSLTREANNKNPSEEGPNPNDPIALMLNNTTEVIVNGVFRKMVRFRVC